MNMPSDSSPPPAQERREFLHTLLQSAAVVGAAGLLRPSRALAQATTPVARPGIHLMSKMLQWLDYPGMAGAAAEIGFDGIDLTVRRGGHVEPERVETDLPKAVAAVKQAGLRVDMMVSDLTEPTPVAARVLAAAAAAGIRYYRLGYYRYDRTTPILAQLDRIKPRLRDLVELGRSHGLVATYQNHAGPSFVGAPVWDFHYLIRDLDPRWVGFQFDIEHATVEGGTAWPTTVRLVADRINTITAKDVRWARKDSGWKPEICPPGEGMVQFAAYAQMLKERGISVPCSLHCEYEGLGGAERGAKQITVEPRVVLDAIRRDLQFVRGVFGA